MCDVPQECAYTRTLLPALQHSDPTRPELNLTTVLLLPTKLFLEPSIFAAELLPHLSFPGHSAFSDSEPFSTLVYRSASPTQRTASNTCSQRWSLKILEPQRVLSPSPTLDTSTTIETRKHHLFVFHRILASLSSFGLYRILTVPIRRH